jgi:hypothetical protein
MRSWFFSTGANHSHRRPVPPVCPFLETLEDRWLPPTNVMSASASVAPSAAASTPPAAANAIASLPHDHIHVLQDQSQQRPRRAFRRPQPAHEAVDRRATSRLEATLRPLGGE